MAIQGIGQTEESAVTGTAAWLASACAILTKEPAYQALLNDPFAIHFANHISVEAPALLAQYDDFETRRSFIAKTEVGHPGLMTVVAYRKPIMERLARAALADIGADQMVVMGAGCDSLSLRLANDGIRPRIFEVDRPEVISFRRSVFADIALDLGHVNEIGVDFDHQDFGDVLIDQGYDTRARTIFFAEGLMGYLEPEAASAIFHFVREKSAPDSRFVFSFTERRRADAKKRVTHQEELDQQGEAPKFDLAPADLEGFVRDHGLVLEHLMTSADIKRDFVPTVDALINVIPYMHIAVVSSPE